MTNHECLLTGQVRASSFVILSSFVIASFVIRSPALAQSYLRHSGAVECSFDVRKLDAGWSIVSQTDRGKVRMQVTSRYDAQDRLLAAEATLEEGEKKSTATVSVEGGKARVLRPGQPAMDFEVPAGVIVTSAPDWTDTFMLARRYDRQKGGKQEFAGLWIHPTQPAQLLRFTIEKLGSDTIEHEGKQLALDRCAIRLRGNSAYTAWIDGAGRLIRLVPPGMVMQGFEKSAATLPPKP
jgi:hypothetical protein